jgi:hypothetical protein
MGVGDAPRLALRPEISSGAKPPAVLLRDGDVTDGLSTEPGGPPLVEAAPADVEAEMAAASAAAADAVAAS